MESSNRDSGNGPDKEEPSEEVENASAEAPAEVGNLALAAAVKAKEEAQKEFLYLRAEFDNYKRRILRDQDQAIKFANEKLVGELLSSVDLLERALSFTGPLKARPDDKEAKDFVAGIEITHRELIQLLTRFGVEFIGNIGESFDPLRHEAIAQRESPEEPDTVLEVLQKGCLLQGRLLKPARVVVALKKA